jgi:hypothetical protein
MESIAQVTEPGVSFREYRALIACYQLSLEADPNHVRSSPLQPHSSWECGESMQIDTSTVYFLKQILGRIAGKQFSLTSAGLAYYFLMSLFPALVLLTTLSSYVPLRNAVDHSLGLIHYVMPEQSESMIRDMVRRLGTRRPGLLSVGFATTVWLASTAVKGIILSLDRAYRVIHSRPRSGPDAPDRDSVFASCARNCSGTC